MSVILEVCAGDYQSAQEAALNGAKRIELCAALEVGGLTPSMSTLRQVKSTFSIEAYVLIRHRSGDFLYTEDEKKIMLSEISEAVEAGADGVVVGALKSDGSIDVDFLRKAITAARSHPVTFHRAFDVCCHPMESLETLVQCGCTRVLTSGCAVSAEKGVELIKRMVDTYGDRIIVMPGCGVTADNVQRIVKETHVSEVHSSCTSTIGSKMEFRADEVKMGASDVNEYVRKVTDGQKVKAILAALSTF